MSETSYQLDKMIQTLITPLNEMLKSSRVGQKLLKHLTTGAFIVFNMLTLTGVTCNLLDVQIRSKIQSS